MRRALLVLVAVGLGLALAGPVGAGAGANCPDFQFQEDAQAAVDANPDLDRDKDGVACETLPKRGATPTTAGPTPAGRTQATTRPMAQTGAATDRQATLAGAALSFGVMLVILSYARTRADRRML